MDILDLVLEKAEVNSVDILLLLLRMNFSNTSNPNFYSVCGKY